MHFFKISESDFYKMSILIILTVSPYLYAQLSNTPVIVSGPDQIEFDANAPPTLGAEKRQGVMTRRPYGDPAKPV